MVNNAARKKGNRDCDSLKPNWIKRGFIYSRFIHDSFYLVAEASRSVAVKVVHDQKRNVLEINQVVVE